MALKISLVLVSLLAVGLAAPTQADFYGPKSGLTEPEKSIDSSEISQATNDGIYDDVTDLGFSYESQPQSDPIAPAGTCALSCGGPSDDQCFCDDSCERYGDCCADKVEVCDDHTTELRGAEPGSSPVTITDLDGHTDIPPDATLQKNLRAWRNFIMLMIRFGEWGQESLGMNGLYDGRISGGVGGSTDAALDLTHMNGEIAGYGFALQNTLVIDAGYWCGGAIEVPVSIFPVEATQGRSQFTATGNLTRNLLVAGSFSVPVQAVISYNLDLDSNDLETLTTDLLLDLPWPCSDTRLYGVFQRQPL